MSVAVQIREPVAPAPASKLLGWSSSAPLSARQKRLIRESFAKIEPALGPVSALFYLRLFELDPSLRALFDGPIEQNERKFTAAMRITVITLDHLDRLSPALKLLGARYRTYGARTAHYVTMARALVWTLEQSLNGKLRREAKEAWATLLLQLTRYMTP